MDIGGNMIGDEAFVVGDGVFVGYNMLEKEYIRCIIANCECVNWDKNFNTK